MVCWQKAHGTAGHKEGESDRKNETWEGRKEKRAGDEGERDRKQKKEGEETGAHEVLQLGTLLSS